MTKKTQIVVVGGGAGGLELVARLGRTYDPRFYDIILLERNQTHIWKPLLHEVAAGALDANLDEVGYRSHAFRWRYRFFLGTLESIDRESRHVVVAPLLDEDGSELVGRHRIRYDYLVLAVGSVTNDYGTPGVREHCLLLDSRAQADRFRQRLLNQCLSVSRIMSASSEADARVRIAIVGGGATGVELAAELYNAAAALRHYGLESFDETRLSVTLIEAGPRILPALPERLSAAAQLELEALGVKVLTGTPVTSATASGFAIKDGRSIEAEIRVWAAGVKGPPFVRTLGLEVSKSDQILVRPTLQTTVDERIFAIGDCAACPVEGTGKFVPPRAQAAHQMAETAFKNLRALISGRDPVPFIYHDHGSLVSLSRFSTVGSLMGSLIGGRLAVEGRLARFVYVSLYRMHIFAIHGAVKGAAMILIGHINQVIRPRLKLH